MPYLHILGADGRRAKARGDPGAAREGSVPNLTVYVAAYTAAGDGPWSLPVPLEPWRPGSCKAVLSLPQPTHRGHVYPRCP